MTILLKVITTTGLKIKNRRSADFLFIEQAVVALNYICGKMENLKDRFRAGLYGKASIMARVASSRIHHVSTERGQRKGTSHQSSETRPETNPKDT